MSQQKKIIIYEYKQLITYKALAPSSMQFLIKLTKKILFFVTLANLLFIDNYINLNTLYLFHLNSMFTVKNFILFIYLFFLQFHIQQRFATNLLATFRSTTIYQPNSATHKSSTSNPTTVCCTPSLPIRHNFFNKLC